MGSKQIRRPGVKHGRPGSWEGVDNGARRKCLRIRRKARAVERLRQARRRGL